VLYFSDIKDANRHTHIEGSAFWIINQDFAHHPAYLVTAGHVLRKIRDFGETVVIRFNPRSGDAKTECVNINRWEPHPDKTVDVAILQIAILGDHAGWPTHSFVTKESVKEDQKQIDLGDEVFFPGYFWPHAPSRNIPIVRIGNIAGLRDERVDIGLESGPSDVYLVEARSIGGLSGSPVFMDVLAARIAKEVGYGKTMLVGPSRFRQVGLMNGHFKGTEKETKPGAISEQELEKLNMGIAFVTPSDKILTGLDVFMEGDKKASEKFKRRHLEFISLDSVSQSNVSVQTTHTGVEIPVPSKDQFLGDLKKASRKKD